MLEAAALWFIGAGFAAFLVAGAWSPLETLAWWAGSARAEEPASERVHVDIGEHGPRPYIVYLGGIDTFEGDSHSSREHLFLGKLRDALIGATLITNVFPYAASGEPLLQAPRLFRWLWRKLDGTSGAHRPLIANLVNLRNFFQVLVSADRRYGPVFNGAVATLIFEALCGSGWNGGPTQPITLIGYSGGAQLALAASPILSRRIGKTPLSVISIGGTIVTTSGLDHVVRLDQLTASSDIAPQLAAILSPAHWPFMTMSPWSRAQASQRLQVVDLGDMRHNGPLGYLGENASARVDCPNWRVTLDAVLAALAHSALTS